MGKNTQKFSITAEEDIIKMNDYNNTNYFFFPHL